MVQSVASGCVPSLSEMDILSSIGYDEKIKLQGSGSKTGASKSLDNESRRRGKTKAVVPKFRNAVAAAKSDRGPGG